MESGAQPAPAAIRGAIRKGVSSKAAAPAAAKKSGSGKARRGELKRKIVALLKGAGEEGVRVKDLARKLGSSYGNITAFFQSTGKGMPEIKKINPAHYAWMPE